MSTGNRFSKLDIEILLQDSTLNVRAIELSKIDGSDVVNYASSNGRISVATEDFLGYFGNMNEIFYREQYSAINDSVEINFRSLALVNNNFYALGIGSPGRIISNVRDSITIVYQDNHPKAFYDSMEFWNDQEGIAIGDSTDGCLSVIITRDGGNTWTKLGCDQLPKGIEGEGAFAASDTNIAIIGNETWVATNTGRIYYSDDKGLSWTIYNTPIVAAKETEGIYSIDFYDNKNGFAIGGDYTKPADSTANKIRTKDGGKTWQLVAQNQSPGYRSCVQYVPNSNAQELVAIGFKGIDYSNDAGNSWTHLSDEGFYTIRFLNDSTAYAAGNKRIAKLKFRK
ncbi:WD40/YVTN/BNR-like repeat-containing protein [Psychroserpens sp. Hel_I_66]|uniref:WD40/YVTN/BNR-like repeat-containing protein n=1 Tax=Psychroserpens sp. Hel_I_66 TaxID=1250004 RepID=UPI000A8232DA|nr:oxidoreductase [Psychroserpens sp. Hel_I_66]